MKPILMTSLTTIFALVPMLWGNDIGTQLQRPMSHTDHRMTVGTFVSLFIIPLFYYYLERILSQEKMKEVIKSIFQYVGAILLAIAFPLFYRGLLQHPFRFDVPHHRTRHLSW
ncbi:MAG: efflux RND transporter permease subunit [Butyricimonas virosa]